MPEIRVVSFKNRGHRNRGGGQRGRNTRGGGHGQSGGGVLREVEVPRFTIPSYLAGRIEEILKAPPGHRFLLYFQGASYTAQVHGNTKKDANQKRSRLESKLENCEWQNVYAQYRPTGWNPLKDSKRHALKTVSQPFSPNTKEMSKAIRKRQKRLWEIAEISKINIYKYRTTMTAPIAIGLGNPHPVENGFSFLSPYGIPYIPGSGIKGVVRRAAEELSLFFENSGWTIPLVWLLFGFDANSAYLAPPPNKLADELRQRQEQWRSAFSEYIEKHAAGDELLKWWLSLEAIRKALPEKLRGLANNPVRFCQTLQKGNNDGKALRKTIHWQGLLRFWDVFPKIDRMEVDIINPHHKAYFEGYANPVEVEAPKPVFFLTVPAGARCLITCELSLRFDDIPLPSDMDKLIAEVIDHSLEWIGFGAKTAVGYGSGERNRTGYDHGNRQQASSSAKNTERKSNVNDIKQPSEDPTAQRKKKFQDFVRSLPNSADLPGQASAIIDRMQGIDDPELRSMCVKEFKNRFQNQIKKAKKNKKTWAEKFMALEREVGV